MIVEQQVEEASSIFINLLIWSAEVMSRLYYK